MHFVHILRLSWPHLSPSPDTQPLASLQVLPSDGQLCVSCDQKPLLLVSAFPIELTFHATVHRGDYSTGSSDELNAEGVNFD